MNEIVKIISWLKYPNNYCLPSSFFTDNFSYFIHCFDCFFIQCFACFKNSVKNFQNLEFYKINKKNHALIDFLLLINLVVSFVVVLMKMVNYVLLKNKKKVDCFTEISSLKKYKIFAAYAGVHHSFFQTNEGEVLECGSNECGQLFLNLLGSK